MEDVKCKKLTATFQDDELFLEGPKNLCVNIDENITIEIEQLGIRIITVVSKQDVSFRKLYKIFIIVEKTSNAFGWTIC